MPYDLDKMRAELNKNITPILTNNDESAQNGEKLRFMREMDNIQRGQIRSKCLIPRSDGNGRKVISCDRPTTLCHIAQKTVLERISSNGKVINFSPKTVTKIAEASKEQGQPIWTELPWNIKNLQHMAEPTGSATTMHLACNECDSQTFQAIEHTAIQWPSWPLTTIIEERQQKEGEQILGNQMFLLAYRGLLQSVRQMIGLLEANQYGQCKDERMSDSRRKILEEQERRIRKAVARSIGQKSKYDRRLTEVAEMPMIHYITGIKPAFPIASADFTQNAAITIFPQSAWEHWLIISTELTHKWSLEPRIQRAIKDAQRTLQDRQISIGWTVQHITTDEPSTIVGSPQSYKLFGQEHSESANHIDRHIHKTVVANCYETYIGQLTPT